MFKTRNTLRHGRRRGMILMVVLALLTLFAIVGISFVFVANAQKVASRNFLDAETKFKPDIDPEAALALALGQLVYDAKDDIQGASSALRGHSLARNMYGWWDGANPSSTTTGSLNDKPFCGVGRLFLDKDSGYLHTSFHSAVSPDPSRYDAALMNFQYHKDDGFVRDPERAGWRTQPQDAVSTWFVGGFNVPYTYPDHNNFYLAQVDAATGQVVVPSFHREYLFGQLDSTANPNWSNHQGKYLTVRPTQKHHTSFPMPVDRFGDVKNLDGAPGGCDSIWIDIGAPVMVSPDGRKYKMLVAPLILELDSRVNLNVVGNWMGRDTSGMIPEHRSNQGWGQWEINPYKVLDKAPMSGTPEWVNIFTGNPGSGSARIRGRYDGSTRGINGRTLQSGGSGLRAWSQFDYNSRNDTSPYAQSTKIGFPTFATKADNGWFFGLPIFPPASYGNGGTIENSTDHAAAYNTTYPTPPNRLFPAREMERVLRYGGTGTDMLASDLLLLLRDNLHPGPTATQADKDAALRRRQLVTMLSADLDRPGVSPWVYNPAANGTASTPADAAATRLVLKTDAAVANLPTLATNADIPFPKASTASNFLSTRNSTPAQSEFDANTWRSTLAALGRIDLGRAGGLPAYAKEADMVMVRQTKHKEATLARQRFVGEIFETLCKVTGALWEEDATTKKFSVKPALNKNIDSGEYRAALYLAQLAVNIVDYFDADDVSTPFNLPGTPHWVYGFETPRLVINEVYAQYDNNKADVDGTNMKVNAGGSYLINSWVELMNPVMQDKLRKFDQEAAAPKDYEKDCIAKLSAYRLHMLDHRAAASLRDASNWNADPDYNKGADPTRVLTDANGTKMIDSADWGANARVLPMADATRFNDAGSAGADKVGFIVVGPPGDLWDNALKIYDPSFDPKPTVETNKLSWKYSADDFETKAPKIRPLIVLQRLANPNLPHDSNVASDYYNPYVTTDYWEVLNNQVIDARAYDLTQDISATQPAVKDRSSYGRFQPHAASDDVKERLITVLDPVNADKPQNTFFRQNTKENDPKMAEANFNAKATDPQLKKPFDWLVHHDRMPISAGELFHVSALRPRDVLRYFVVKGAVNKHKAPWAEPTARIHRFLEFASTVNDPYRYDTRSDPTAPPPTPAVTTATGFWGRPNGRVPGKINLNMVMEHEVFWALCDAQNGNVFEQSTNKADAQDDVNRIFNQLLDIRTPVVTLGSLSNKRIAGPTDSRLIKAPFNTVNNPFWGFAMGKAADDAADLTNRGVRGTDLTPVRSLSATQLLFDVVEPTPAKNKISNASYQSKELLTKIFNNFTTRSNVFAVWMTVGYFEVTDETKTPPVLGAEIGKAENRHVRHRMFAIVDRTMMTAFSTKNKDSATIAPGNDKVINVDGQGATGSYMVRDMRTGRDWQLTKGTVLVYDPGQDNEEAVVLKHPPDAMDNTKLDTTKLAADFRRYHSTNCLVICHGNPGPMTRYDPRKDADVVPYWTLID